MAKVPKKKSHFQKRHFIKNVESMAKVISLEIYEGVYVTDTGMS